MINPYQPIKSDTLYKGRVIALQKSEFILPNNHRTVREIVTHPGAVLILPLTGSGELLMIKQFRFAIGNYLLEFPAGTLEPGENPLECAKREIVEEVGYRATNWTDLGTFYPAPGFCDEIQYGYLARELVPETATCDEDEIIEVRPMKILKVEQAIASGELQDSKSIALFTRAKLRGLI